MPVNRTDERQKTGTVTAPTHQVGVDQEAVVAFASLAHGTQGVRRGPDLQTAEDIADDVEAELCGRARIEYVATRPLETAGGRVGRRVSRRVSRRASKRVRW